MTMLARHTAAAAMALGVNLRKGSASTSVDSIRYCKVNYITVNNENNPKLKRVCVFLALQLRDLPRKKVNFFQIQSCLYAISFIMSIKKLDRRNGLLPAG